MDKYGTYIHTHTGTHICKHVHKVRRVHTHTQLHNIMHVCSIVVYTHRYMLHLSALSGIKINDGLCQGIRIIQVSPAMCGFESSSDMLMQFDC